MTAFTAFLVTQMFLRLWLPRTDAPDGIGRYAGVTALQVVALCVFHPGWQLALLTVVILLINALGLLLWLRGRGAAIAHSSTFVLTVVAAGLLFNGHLHFADWSAGAVTWLAAHTVLAGTIASDDWAKLCWISAGSLFLTQEANYWIRVVLQRIDRAPQKDGATDEAEFNAGRVIGILERNLIFLVLILANSYAAVGFIIAAKGFARFKQMDERNFAEYILIGTLASMLITILTAAAVRLLW